MTTFGHTVRIAVIVFLILIVTQGVSKLTVTLNESEAGKPVGGAGMGTPDVTAKLELLGNPSKSQYPDHPTARTPWDMQTFNGRVYIGQGDANENVGTAVSPVAAWYYDPGLGTFVKEYETDDEEINLYRLFDTLFIPGIDPRGGIGCNHYRYKDTGFTRQSQALCQHLWSIERFDGKLFAANSGGVVRMSSDDGTTWTDVLVLNTEPGYEGSAFFVFGGTLYTQVVYNNTKDLYYRFDGTTFKPISASMLPRSSSKYMNPRIVYYKDKIAYIAGSYLNGRTPGTGVYAASSLTDAVKTAIPSGEEIWDIIKALDKRGMETVYVLASTYKSKTTPPFTTKIYATTDLSTWSPIFMIKSKENYYKSFESLSGDFYFGVGSGLFSGGPNIGNIMRLRAADVP